MNLTVPIHFLSTSSEDRTSFLSNYFSGKFIKTTLTEDVLTLNLQNPDEKDYYIDPDLSVGLNWWSKGISVAEIPNSRKNKLGYTLSLNDNWTLNSWSQWLFTKIKEGYKPEEIILLHIDDHLDCMSPLLFQDNNKHYLDPISKAAISLEDPTSIELAIKSGSITIGSFMPVFLHYFSKVEFRHLMPLHRQERAYKEGPIARTFEKDTFLDVSRLRPSIAFEHPDKESGLYYHPFTKVDDFINDLSGNSPIFLHVDMDYFNNRFDGDSDWLEHSVIHNPSSQDVLNSIEKIFKTLLTKIPFKQLENITIALSPGFFPADLWEDSIKAIDKLFQQYYHE